MNVRFQASFAKDLRALKDKALLERIKELIASVEAAHSLAEVSNVKKLHGSSGFYRVRIGDYRTGWRRAPLCGTSDRTQVRGPTERVHACFVRVKGTT